MESPIEFPHHADTVVASLRLLLVRMRRTPIVRPQRPALHAGVYAAHLNWQTAMTISPFVRMPDERAAAIDDDHVAISRTVGIAVCRDCGTWFVPVTGGHVMPGSDVGHCDACLETADPYGWAAQVASIPDDRDPEELRAEGLI